MQLKDNAIVITQFDRRRLEALLGVMRDRSGHKVAYLEDLEEELERARIVDPHEVPADVVTMNSKVRLADLDTGEQLDVTLVFPGASNARESRISVLAPMGLALFGGREGDELRWPAAHRLRRVRIERVVYQPEAAGNYLL